MFVIKNDPAMVNKTFRLPVTLTEELDRVAKSRGVSMNNLVRQCCEYALGNLPDGQELEPEQK